MKVCPLLHCIWTINTVTGAKLPGKAKWTMKLGLKTCNQEDQQRKGRGSWQIMANGIFKLGPRVHGLQLAIVCMKVVQWVPPYPYPTRKPLKSHWYVVPSNCKAHQAQNPVGPSGPATTPPHRLGREWSQQYLADFKTHRARESEDSRIQPADLGFFARVAKGCNMVRLGNWDYIRVVCGCTGLHSL